MSENIKLKKEGDMYRVICTAPMSLGNETWEWLVQVSEGEVGGLVESPENIATREAWVANGCTVKGTALIGGGSAVIGNAVVSGDAYITNSLVAGNACIGEKSRIDNAVVDDHAQVWGEARIEGATVYGCAQVQANARIKGGAVIGQGFYGCDTYLSGGVKIDPPEEHRKINGGRRRHV